MHWTHTLAFTIIYFYDILPVLTFLWSSKMSLPHPILSLEGETSAWSDTFLRLQAADLAISLLQYSEPENIQTITVLKLEYITENKIQAFLHRFSLNSRQSKLKGFSPRTRIFLLNSREIPNCPPSKWYDFLLYSRFYILNSRFRKFCCSWNRKIGEKSLK